MRILDVVERTPQLNRIGLTGPSRRESSSDVSGESMNVLGISAFYHDSAAAILKGGRVVAAAQQERFSRVKNDERFPREAIEYCLSESGLQPDKLDAVAFYEKPLRKFHRMISTYVASTPTGYPAFQSGMSAWIGGKLRQRSIIQRSLEELGLTHDLGDRLVFSDHHQSHAASAFYPSPFSDAAVLTVDGVGEWATTCVAVGHDADLDILKEIRFPHSLGLLYAAFTAHLGFKVNHGEYKVMGLAPYGKPRFLAEILGEIVEQLADGSFQLNIEWFDYASGSSMTSEVFTQRFGPKRAIGQALNQRHLDIAASIQKATEELMLGLANGVYEITGSPNLCLAGGVALNCVANSRISRDGPFQNVWVQPAAGDAGGALGAAYVGHHTYLQQRRRIDPAVDGMKASLLGPSYSSGQIEQSLSAAGLPVVRFSFEKIVAHAVAALEAGRVVGWFQGRMEFGPRALGSRSILADPRSAKMQRILNEKVKRRESFRPFAPAVLRTETAGWFDIEHTSPYMLFVAKVADRRRVELSKSDRELEGLDQLRAVRSQIPAVTHVDYSARIQTVDEHSNPRFHKLLRAWFERTGCPILLNTSLNGRDEPIVASPDDAVACFLGTDIDVLYLEEYVITKGPHVFKSRP